MPRHHKMQQLLKKINTLWLNLCLESNNGAADEASNNDPGIKPPNVIPMFTKVPKRNAQKSQNFMSEYCAMIQ